MDEVIATAGQLAEKNQNRLIVEAQENVGALNADPAALGGDRDSGLVGRLAALLDREDTEAARRLLEALEALLVSRGDAQDAAGS